MKLIRLANFKEIKERWDTSKKQIESYYVGKSPEKVISLMELAYSHSLHVRQIVKKNLFFDLYFFPLIYQEENTEVSFNIFPFVPPVAYQVESRETYRNRAGKTVVHLKGICTDKRSLQDIEEKNQIILNKEPELNGILNLKYKLNEQDHTLYSLIGELTVAGDGGEIRKIEIECFQLNNDDKPGPKRSY
jgi:hypothetical protein